MRAPICTERLVLRDVTEADAERLVDLDSDPEVMRYLSARSRYDAAAYRERIRGTYLPFRAHAWHGFYLAFDRATDAFLGWVIARPAPGHPFARDLGWTREDEIEIGYRFRRAAWGRGIATEAALPLVAVALADPATAAVVACARADNRGSLRVLEKLKLERTGEAVLPGVTEPVVILARRSARPRA
jgi:RimJ/RimL family protein N-acetyltransferase